MREKVVYASHPCASLPARLGATFVIRQTQTFGLGIVKHPGLIIILPTPQPISNGVFFNVFQ